MVLDALVSWLVEVVGALGYFGVFTLMFLESSFFPFPSEVVIIPAGYLAFLGEMNLWLVVFFGVLGSLAGAWFNYYLASRFGRRFVLKILSREKLSRVEDFFEKHGEVSTFNGRLVPVVRQYISFPAGLARMNGWRFSLYTGLGALVWVFILALMGFYLGANEELLRENLRVLTWGLVGFVVVVSLGYWAWKRK